MSRRLATLAALTAASALAGCSMAPHYKRGAAPVAPSFPTGPAYQAPVTEGELPAVDRTTIFRDTRLQQLLTQALANNRDLRVAAANIERARAQYRVQRAAIFPELDANGQVQATDTPTSNATSVSGNLSVTSWEVDLFGRLRSLSSAAQETYFASEATARATRLTLLGDVSTAWLNYAADASLLTLAQSTAESARKSVELTQARLRGGVAARTDLASAQTTLATAESDFARQKTALAQDINALTLLVGASIDTALLPASIEEAGATIGDPPTTMSTAVLLRRPDVLAAEYNLRSANANIGAARAALFPRITLGGLIGLAAGSFESLFGNAGRSALQGTAAASYPIFRAGAGRNNLVASEAQRDALLATYEKSIQTAFREVSDQLARRGTIDEQLGADSRNAAAATDAFQLSEARYRGGVDSFLANLVTQRTLYTAQRTLVATRLTAATNRVALYRTLGGDALTPAADEPTPR